MQFDHVFLYMAFGAAVAMFGFVLALLAKSGDGHGSFEVFGISMSLQAAGGILVIAIGAVIFMMPMIMGRDLNQAAEIAALQSNVTRLNSENQKLSASLSDTKALLASKVALSDLKFNYLSVAYPTEEPMKDCAEKIAKKFEVGQLNDVQSGWLVGEYDDGVVYFVCRQRVAIVAVAKTDKDAAWIIDDAKSTVQEIYPETDPSNSTE